MEGEVVAIVHEWHGRPVSANWPVLVQFDKKFRAHFKEDEVEHRGVLELVVRPVEHRVSGRNDEWSNGAARGRVAVTHVEACGRRLRQGVERVSERTRHRIALPVIYPEDAVQCR